MRGHETENRYACSPSPTMRSRSDSQRTYWSAAGSPVEPSSMRPGCAQNVSQMDGPRPSAVVEPSTWNADVAAPHTNPSGKRIDAGATHPVGVAVGVGAGSGASSEHAASRPSPTSPHPISRTVRRAIGGPSVMRTVGWSMRWLLVELSWAAPWKRSHGATGPWCQPGPTRVDPLRGNVDDAPGAVPWARRAAAVLSARGAPPRSTRCRRGCRARTSRRPRAALPRPRPRPAPGSPRRATPARPRRSRRPGPGA